jgi:hypothetical protein
MDCQAQALLDVFHSLKLNHHPGLHGDRRFRCNRFKTTVKLSVIPISGYAMASGFKLRGRLPASSAACCQKSRTLRVWV